MIRRAANLDVRVATLPPIEIPAAAVELATTNYLSNAIKYANPAQPHRWVEIRGRISGPDRDGENGENAEAIVGVWDNGLGVPEDERAHLFARGFRAHAGTVTGVEGTGLGLSIVKDAIEAAGGRVWVGFPPNGGACFAFALPARRAGEPRALVSQ